MFPPKRTKNGMRNCIQESWKNMSREKKVKKIVNMNYKQDNHK